ncbi:MAG: glycosyltransferase [Acidimicrobiia bacterium]
MNARSEPLGTPDATPWVCFAAVDWWYHNRAHSEVQLMTRVARDRPVLFVNSIGMRMPLPGRSSNTLSRLVRKAKSIVKVLRSPVGDLPNFHVLSPVVVPFYSKAWVRRLNAALVRAQVRAAMRKLGFQRTPVMFVTIPTAWDVVAPMSRRALVFNRVDKHSTFEETDQSLIASLETQLLANADLTLFVSGALLEEEQPVTGDRGVFFDHAVDIERFTVAADAPEPADLAAIAHPRIGFFGGLDDYVIDFDLIEAIAHNFTDAQVVLVGMATCSMDRFDAMTNVHWLGYQPYESIARYGAGFDVAILPRLDNEWSRYTNPIKLKEYLALGLPIVTRDVPEAHRYASLLRIARTADDFLTAIDQTLADGGLGTRAERRAAVVNDTWDQRTAELVTLVHDLEVRS